MKDVCVFNWQLPQKSQYQQIVWWTAGRGQTSWPYTKHNKEVEHQGNRE